MEWMRYLTLDQALALLSNKFDLEKHLTLDQVYFYSYGNFSFYRFIFILSTNMQRKEIKRIKFYSITYSWE